MRQFLDCAEMNCGDPWDDPRRDVELPLKHAGLGERGEDIVGSAPIRVRRVVTELRFPST